MDQTPTGRTGPLVMAAGGVVARPGLYGPELVIIHRPKYDDWSFPKGKVDPGETLEQAALREVYEEAALRCRLGRPLLRKEYPGKEVHYWEMHVDSEETFLPNQEIDDLRWVAADRAPEMLSHPQDRQLLGEFLDLLRV